MKYQNSFLFLLLLIPLFFSCNDSQMDTQPTTTQRQFGIFRVQQNNTTVIMDGTINSSSLQNFNALVRAFPKIKHIDLKNCDGSSDDIINLQLAKLIYDKKLSIHLVSNGTIASGGVDFFLAGAKRTKGSQTRIGVHSWANGHATATDYAVGHSNHLPYINYYVYIGFTQKKAEEFYYFTINAAPAMSMHWMTEHEIQKYGILKN
jgi:hypothetical protein